MIILPLIIIPLPEGDSPHPRLSADDQSRLVVPATEALARRGSRLLMQVLFSTRRIEKGLYNRVTLFQGGHPLLGVLGGRHVRRVGAGGAGGGGGG